MTFTVDGGATAFSLGGVIRTVITSDESIETAFVVDWDSDTATADLVETSETLTLDELHPTSIAEMVEVIEPSTGTEVLASDADISVTESAVTESAVAETLMVVVASESEEVDEDP